VGLRASGQVMRFPGFLDVYSESQEDNGSEDESSSGLPDVREGEALRLLGERPEQHFTQPPPRYSEALLVRELERRASAGRRPTPPSSPHPRPRLRGKARRGACCTELGTVVNGLLIKSFPDILNADFTAQMRSGWTWSKKARRTGSSSCATSTILRARPSRAKVEMRDLRREEEPTEEVCDKCGRPMVIKWGRNGYFLACSGYPECRKHQGIHAQPDGSLTVLPPRARPARSARPAARHGDPARRYGESWLLAVPECKTTSPCRSA